MPIVPLDRTQPIVDEEGMLSLRAAVWAELVSNLSPLTGTGSPEGVVEAINDPPRFYVDTAGTAGSILYVKRDADISGDRTKGWILV